MLQSEYNNLEPYDGGTFIFCVADILVLHTGKRNQNVHATFHFVHICWVKPQLGCPCKNTRLVPAQAALTSQASTERGKVQGMMMGNRQTGGKVVESWTRGASLSPRMTDCLCPHPLLLIGSLPGVEGRQVFRMSTTVFSDTGLLNKEQFFKNQFCGWRWLSD